MDRRDDDEVQAEDVPAEAKSTRDESELTDDDLEDVAGGYGGCGHGIPHTLCNV